MSAPRNAARGALAALIALAVVAALLCLVFAAMTLGRGTGEFQVSLSVATPLELAPLVAGASGESVVAYDTVTISTWDALPGPRAMAAVSSGAYFAVFFAACVVVILLAVRLWRQTPFAALATASAAVLGVLAVIVSVVGPWLRISSAAAAVAELGYPTSGAGPDDEWVVPGAFDIQNVDWVLLAFGALLALTAAMFAVGRRLQRDTEGLV